MIHRLRCVARCVYDGAAESASAVLRLYPRALPHQRVRACASRVEPRPAVLREGTDHFGNPVVWLLFDRPHAGFEAVSDSVVEVSAPAVPDPFATPAWEAVARAGASADALAHGAAEFVFGSPLAPADPAARAYAAGSFPPGFPVLAGVLDLLGRVGRDARTGRGHGVAVPAGADPRRGGAGMGRDQDLAHAMIAGLRGLGLPARYVLGCARRDGAGGARAWVDCWLGPRHGWLGLDPADDRVVGDEYVVLGRGRDAADVPPARVVPTGGGACALAVDVALDPGP